MSVLQNASPLQPPSVHFDDWSLRIKHIRAINMTGRTTIEEAMAKDPSISS